MIVLATPVSIMSRTHEDFEDEQCSLSLHEVSSVMSLQIQLITVPHTFELVVIICVYLLNLLPL